MDGKYIGVVAAMAEATREDADTLCKEAADKNAPLQVTQALLAASWSLRSASFALRLAAQMVDPPAQPQPARVPSDKG